MNFLADALVWLIEQRDSRIPVIRNKDNFMDENCFDCLGRAMNAKKRKEGN
jgi:hypothetical protein